jgi:LysR family glycine cleavage system transcriptional activator
MSISVERSKNQYLSLKLPPLNGFRVFESVARLGNVAMAAQELCVTPGAVSQQLRTIQSILGIDLFEKRGRNLVLTEDGRALHMSVSAALSEIHNGVKQISAKSRIKPIVTSLTISMPHTFGASANMIQRLFDFSKGNQHITTQIRSHMSFADIDWTSVDIAIINGNPPWQGFWWKLLRGIQLTPVCSPRLVEGPVSLTRPSDLSSHQLLHDDDGSNWRRWLAQVNVPLSSRPLMTVDNFDILIQLARSGNGVALVDENTFANSLNDGTLIRPFAESIPANEHYYLVQQEGKATNHEAKNFFHWIMDDIPQMPVPYRPAVPEEPLDTLTEITEFESLRRYEHGAPVT